MIKSDPVCLLIITILIVIIVTTIKENYSVISVYRKHDNYERK